MSILFFFIALFFGKLQHMINIWNIESLRFGRQNFLVLYKFITAIFVGGYIYLINIYNLQ